MALVATIGAAIVAIAVAARANKITQDSAERQLRAYLAADPHVQWEKAYVGTPDNIFGYTVIITWKNYGQTPARLCRMRTSLGVFDQRISANFDYADNAALQIITKNTHIGPGQFFLQRVGGLTIRDSEAVERRQKFAYVWSWSEYHDIFGRARRRTEICFELQIRDGGKTLIPTVYGPFNGADEDCHHKPKT